jgi:glycogen debranching enzyme
MTVPMALRARPRHHFVYSARSLLVTTIEGQVTGTGTEGFYVDNARLLSRLELAADGKPVVPFAAAPVDSNAILSYAEVPEGPNVPKRGVFVEAKAVVEEALRLHLLVRSYATEPAEFELEVHLAADFADSQEASQGRRQQTADVETSWNQESRRLSFRYCHPDLDRAVVVSVKTGPDVRFTDGTLAFPLHLSPGAHAAVELAATPVIGEREGRGRQLDGRVEDAKRVRQELRDQTPALVTTNTAVGRAWRTATSDLASLPVGTPHGPATPIAGVPLYQQLFGRDAFTIAWQSALAMPAMLADALRENAAWQGRVVDDWLDEEPGKMLHQAEWGPLAALGKNPFARYYGDYATVPDFLIGLGQYLAWTSDLATLRQLLPAARAGIAWAERYGDLDGDGFLEYVARSEHGVKNQGWKDAANAVVDEHGEIVKDPIATSELQAYWYIGLKQAALAFFLAGDRAYALELKGKAAELRRRFDEAFWMPEEGFYAMALGPDKKQVRSIASNAGHLLATGIVPKSKARAVVRRLMAPDLFSGWGIRTLSTGHPRYNPFSYHLGSVWPVDSATFALGFVRYGCWEEAHRLAEGLVAASELFVANRLPEALGGIARDADHAHPGIYPDANEPQGWSASAIVLVVQALLGLRPFAPARVLVVDPHLPEWLPDVRLEGVRVGDAVVDLEASRGRSGETRLHARVRSGRLGVIRQPPPQAPVRNPLRRLIAATEGVFE